MHAECILIYVSLARTPYVNCIVSTIGFETNVRKMENELGGTSVTHVTITSPLQEPSSGLPSGRTSEAPTPASSSDASPPLFKLLSPVETDNESPLATRGPCRLPCCPTPLHSSPLARTKLNLQCPVEYTMTLTVSPNASMLGGSPNASIPSRPRSPGVSVCDVKDPLWWEETPIIAHRRKCFLRRLENGKASLEPELVDEPPTPEEVRAIADWQLTSSLDEDCSE